MSERDILRRIIVACFVLIVASILTSIIGWHIPSPNNWLVDWTAWIGSVVVIVVAARVFWLGTDNLFALLKDGLANRKKSDNKTAT